MHIIVIIIHRYFISCIDRMSRCDTRLFFYIEFIISILITCMIHSFWWILVTWYFLTCNVVINSFIIDTNTWLCISLFFWKLISLFNELFVWTLIQLRFEYIITLSMVDVYELFVSLLLKCGLIVIHIFFLDLNKTFLPSFLLDELNTMNIYFTS